MNKINGFETVGNVRPFQYWCHKILPLVYDDSLSYYELLCKVVHSLNEVISSNNITNSNVLVLKQEFDKLKEYVDSYFDNLDVQEEIDNKLDEMFANGELPELIVELLTKQKVFNTTEELINSDVNVGMYCRTLGYRTKGFGGGNFIITNIETPDCILLNNGSYARLIDDKISPEQFGAWCDTTLTLVTDEYNLKQGYKIDTIGHYDDVYLQKCIEVGRPILLNGVYTIQNTLMIPREKGILFYGNGTDKTFIVNNGNDYLFTIRSEFTERTIFNDITFIGTLENKCFNVDSLNWGGCIELNNFNIYYFSTIFNFVSTFKCEINNGYIVSQGVSNFTYPNGTDNSKRFCNCNTFNNVWFYPIPAILKDNKTLENTPITFTFCNTKQTTFNECQFDRQEVICKGITKGASGEKVDNIIFNNCWLERDSYVCDFANANVITEQDGDGIFMLPRLINCRTSRIHRYNKGNSGSRLDIANQNISNPPIYTDSFNQDTYKDLTFSPKQIFNEQILYSTHDNYRKSKVIYEESSRGMMHKLPINSLSNKTYESNTCTLNIRYNYDDSANTVIYNVFGIVHFNDDTWIIRRHNVIVCNRKFMGTLNDIDIYHNTTGKAKETNAKFTVDSTTGVITLTVTGNTPDRCCIIADYNATNLNIDL